MLICFLRRRIICCILIKKESFRLFRILFMKLKKDFTIWIKLLSQCRLLKDKILKAMLLNLILGLYVKLFKFISFFFYFYAKKKCIKALLNLMKIKTFWYIFIVVKKAKLTTTKKWKKKTNSTRSAKTSQIQAPLI